MSELQQACEEAGVTISSVHLNVDYTDDKFPTDKWSCTLTYEGKSATFDFTTGSGHRVLAMGVKREGNRKYVYRTTGDVVWGERAAIEKNLLILKRVKGKTVGPSVADLVSSLLSDAEACETTFDDWFSNFGSDNDSLKALNTYIACQRAGSKLFKVLGYKLAQELKDKEH